MKILFFLLFFSSLGFSSAPEFLPDNFSVKIEQIHNRFGTGKEVRVPFLLEYSYPGKMKYFNEKNKSLFVCNKSSSWYYMPAFIKTKPGTVKINSGDSFRLVNLFDSLKAGLVTNKTYAVKKINESKYQLIFEERAQKEFNVQSVELEISKQVIKERANSRSTKMPVIKKEVQEETFSFKDLSKISIEYRDKKKLGLQFKDFSKNVAFEHDHFIFSIPENTKIIK